jgi:hypothetical protein
MNIGGTSNMAKHQEKPTDEKFANGLTARKEFTEGTIELGPRESRSMPLGQYDEGDPTPEFTVTVDPEIEEEMIGMSLDRFDYSDSALCYLLHYQFENYGDKTCKITVRLKNAPEDKAGDVPQ